jgi:predicted site-specific integrase-resolvase
LRAASAPTTRGKQTLSPRASGRADERSTTLDLRRPRTAGTPDGRRGTLTVPEVGPKKPSRFSRTSTTRGTARGVEFGYARVSTVKQDLDRQTDALEQTGIPRDRIYVDKKSGATTERPGLREVIAYAREGDVIVVHTLDRLGRTVRDTLNLTG